MPNDDYDPDGFDGDPGDEDGDFEPIGSCDNCDTNLYMNDCYVHHGDQLCGQCYWWATEARKL